MNKSATNRRFTLKPGKWFAMMQVGDEFHSPDWLPFHTSPIRIERITPLKSGNGEFRLLFFHANYPQGVQEKEYHVQTIHRGQRMIVLKSVNHDPLRFLHITPINRKWLQFFFPEWTGLGEDAQQCLNRAYQ